MAILLNWRELPFIDHTLKQSLTIFDLNSNRAIYQDSNYVNREERSF